MSAKSVTKDVTLYLSIIAVLLAKITNFTIRIIRLHCMHNNESRDAAYCVTDITHSESVCWAHS